MGETAPAPGGAKPGGGATLYLPASVIEAWMARARPGEWLAYAVGAGLDPREPVVARVRAWLDAGAVIATKQRIGAALHHRVTRAGAVSASGAAPVEINGRARAAAKVTGPEAELLRFIERLTVAAQPMPSNARIAEALGWKDRDAVAYRLRRLIEQDLVRVPPVGRFATRIVTVMASGKRTADAR